MCEDGRAALHRPLRPRRLSVGGPNRFVADRSPQQTVPAVRRTTLLLLVSFGLLFGVGGVVARSSLDDRGTASDRRTGTEQADAAYIAAVYRGCGGNEECVKSRIEGMVNADPIGSVEAVLEMFEGQAVAHVGCHWAMHLVGQILKPRTLAGERFELGRLWLSCNAAPLHGAYESLDIEGDPAVAGKKAFDLCYDSGFDATVLGHCFHPIGHTLLLNLPADEGGDYLEAAETACVEGAWANRDRFADVKPGEPAGNVAGNMLACLGGAHMGYRDNVARQVGESSDTEGATWEDVLPQCHHSLLPYGCITLYFDDLLYHKEEASTRRAIDLLRWCNERSTGAGDSCPYFFGLSLVGSYQEPMSSRLLQVCMDAAPAGDRVRNACMRGVLDELDTEISSREPVEQEFCGVLEKTPGAGATCEDILEFSMTYPRILPLQELVTARDAALTERPSRIQG